VSVKQHVKHYALVSMYLAWLLSVFSPTHLPEMSYLNGCGHTLCFI